MPVKAKNWVICHFEDEAQRVDLYDLIEEALFQHPGFSNTDIESSDDGQTHVITFTYADCPHRLVYLIRDDLSQMDADASKIGGGDIILTLLDLWIAEDRTRGAFLAQELWENGRREPMWIVTGYAADARRACDQLQVDHVRIIAKPPNHIRIRDEIVCILEQVLSGNAVTATE